MTTRPATRLLRLLLPLLLLTAAWGQQPSTTTVSATVTDPTGQAYANAAYTFSFIDGPLQAGQVTTIDGTPLTTAQRTVTGTADSTGTFSTSVLNTLYPELNPQGARWKVTITYPGGTPTFNVVTANGVISGISTSLSSLLSGAAPVIGGGGGGSTIIGKLQDKGGAVYNVKSYGAAGNGTTDDTANIQTAMTSACGAGGALYFPQGTYVISPPTNAYVFTMNGCNIEIYGAGQGTTTLQIKASAGDYDTIFGPKFGTFGAVTIHDMTIDQNSANNAMTAITHPRFVIGGGGTSLNVHDATFLNINAVNTFYSVFNQTVIADNIFSGIGGGTFYHDYSAIYASHEGITIHHNQFLAGGLNQAGATTAIETHAGQTTVTGNVIDSMFLGANITGVESAGDTTGVVFQGNTITNGYYGFELWSQTSGGHSSGYGLANITIAENTMRLTQTAWTTSPTTGTTPVGNPSGIFCNPALTLPMKSINFIGNNIEFDLEASGTPPFSTDAVGIGCRDSNNTTTVMADSWKIADNIIKNSTGIAIRLSLSFQDILINNNHIINAGSSGNSSFGASFRDGLFIAPPTGGVCSRLTTKGNSISDTQATSTLVRGDYLFIIAACTGLEVANDTVSVADATHTSFLYPVDVAATITVPPLVRATSIVASLTSGMMPSHGVAYGSFVNDGNAGGTWNVGSNGTTWTLNALSQNTTGAAWTGTYTPTTNKVLGGSSPSAVTLTSTYVDSSICSNAGCTQTAANKGVVYFWCTGTATASVTIDLFPGQGAATTCNSTSTAGLHMGAHTFKNLYCDANNGGISGSSGVVTVFVNGSSSSLTCTFGTGTTCSDSTDSATSTLGQNISVRFTTQGSETLAGVRCALDVN